MAATTTEKQSFTRHHNPRYIRPCPKRV